MDFTVDAIATGSSNTYAGGLVGLNNGGVIANCYSTGNVAARSSTALSSAFAGGLVGQNNDGRIVNCYATGDVTVNGPIAYAGGLAGYNQDGTIVSCYATGNISATGTFLYDAGGLVGNSTGTITNCYRYEGQTVTRNNATTGINTDGATCSDADLNNSAFYTRAAYGDPPGLGWDADVWDFSGLGFADGKYAEGKNPYLRLDQNH